MDQKTDTKPVLQVLSELEVGESVTYPVSRMNSIKSMCSTFGLQWDKVFATSINREERTLTVTRKK